MNFKRHFKNYFLLLAGFTLISTACEKKNADFNIGNTGTIDIEVTDAPIDNPEVRSAYITLSGMTFTDTNLLQERISIDLMAYQKGNTKSIGSFQIPAKKYDHISIKLDLQEDSFGSIPGCFVATEQGKKHNLYPSNNLFSTLTLPLENLEISPDSKTTLLFDFDLRKLIRYGESASEIKYQFVDDRSMEDAIRVLDKNATGSINGFFSDDTGQDFTIMVYVYQAGSFNKSREIKSAETDLPNFFNAENSSLLESDGELFIPYLNKGNYELIFVALSSGSERDLIGILDVQSTSGAVLNDIHIEPGNEINLQGSILELQPY